MPEEQNALMAMLTDMDGTRWLILGVILLILEVVTGTTYILWLAIAALVTGLTAFALPMLGWEMQFLLFSIISIILLFIGHNYIRPKIKSDEPSDLNDRARSMIGMRVRAVTDFELGAGRVQVGDTQWRAKATEGNPKAGDELRVRSVKGTTLNVEDYAAKT
ncbi:MAG: NfeD family protein [Hellea sp.]|nr:NfeD family protein [Hellea sp.]